MSGAGIVAQLAGAAPDLIKSAASGAANSGTYGAENTSTIPLAPESTGTAETQAANAIPGANQQATQGLQTAAQKEQGIATPVGATVSQAGQTTTKSGVQQQQNAIDEYRNSVQATHVKALATEQALTDAQSKAQIDPQRYLQNLGVGQKTLTAIGLALSGIGSGLTGQPNLAMQVVQKNIDRDIQAQQQLFQNKMEAVATQRGLLQSAQDRQNLAQLALAQATVMVTQGANTAIQGVQTQVAGATAPDVVNQMILQNQQRSAEALSNINTKYVQLIKSGNTKQVNQLGLALDTAQQQMTGSPTGINKRPHDTAKSQVENNAIFKQPEQSQNSSLGNILQQESNKRNVKVPQEDFLDAMAKAGSK